MIRRLLFLSYLSVFGSLTACSLTPSKRVHTICPSCQKHNLNTSSKYPVIAYSKNLNANHDLLHIYLEGDGRPWTRNGQPNINPNSHALTALTLMSLDTHPSIYINRPCYGYPHTPKNCSSELWTMARYSETVVAAMQNAILETLGVHYFKEVVLIGHSGGGTIAMLLASRLKDVAGVITLGANLDPKSWTEYFQYLPLDGSLNPTLEPPLSKNIFRWHFAGDKDRQVPAKLTQSAAQQDPGSEFMLKKGYDHNCCWRKDWSEILDKIDKHKKSPNP